MFHDLAQTAPFAARWPTVGVFSLETHQTVTSVQAEALEADHVEGGAD